MVRKTITTITFSVIILSRLNAQCISAGPNSPTISSENTSIGTVSLLNTGLIYSSDNSRASANALVLGNKSHYLLASGFGFSIPDYAIICGIMVEIEKRATGLLQDVEDYSVKIVKGGNISGAEKAQAGTWSFSDAYSTYGSNTDLWDVTWTPEDINAINFGVAISADLWGISVLPSAQIDHFKITVYYDVSLPMGLIDFKATRLDNTIGLNWSTSSESNNDFFTVERSQDSKIWETRDLIDGAGNSETVMNYSFTELNYYNKTTYYRLKQIDFNGNYSYSEAVSVPPYEKFIDDINIYPNPSSDIIIIETAFADKEELKLVVMDYMGKEVTGKTINSDDYLVDISNLPKGIYTVLVTKQNQIISKKFIKM